LNVIPLQLLFPPATLHCGHRNMSGARTHLWWNTAGSSLGTVCMGQCEERLGPAIHHQCPDSAAQK